MPRSSKRQSSVGAVAGAGKKAKTNPSFAGVQEGIELNAELPEACRQMLISSIAPALGALSEERQEVQNSLVGMIGEALEGVRSQLRRSVEEATAKAQEIESSRNALQAQVSEAEGALVSAGVETKGRTARLAEATEKLREAKAEVSAKEEAQVQGDKAFDEAKAKLAELDEAIANHYTPLAGEGSGEQHYKALLPIMKQVVLDQSLLSALSSSCTKDISLRTAFDTMAIDQLGKSLEEKAAELREVVNSGMPAAQERAGAVESAKVALEGAIASQQLCVDDLSTAKQAESNAAAALETAKQALGACEPELALATQSLSEKTSALEQFGVYNIGCFELLRDAQAPKAPEPKIIEETEAPLQSEAAATAAAEAGA